MTVAWRLGSVLRSALKMLLAFARTMRLMVSTIALATILIRSVTFSGTQGVDDASLRALLDQQIPGTLDAKKLESDLQRINAYFRTRSAAGIPEHVASWNVDALGILNVRIVPDRIKAVQIVGNTRSKDPAVRHMLRLHAGDPISESAMKTDYSSLMASGLFSSVDIAIPEIDDEDHVVLRWSVKEKKTLDAGLTGGYQGGRSGTGFSGTFTLSQANLAGNDVQASAKLERGAGVSDVDLSLAAPYVASNYGAHARVFNAATQQANSSTTEYSAGVDLGIERRASSRLTYNAGTRLSRDATAYSNTTITAPSVAPLTSGQRYATHALYGGVRYDARNDRLRPRSGTMFTVSTTASERALGSSYGFTQTTLDAAIFKPLGTTATDATHVRYGVSTGIVPFNDLFALSDQELRAYSQLTYGTNELLLQNEFRYPLTRSIGFAAFAETGGVGIRGSQTMRFRSDVGFGLRLSLPALGIDTVRLDLAKGSSGPHVSFGIGESF